MEITHLDPWCHASLGATRIKDPDLIGRFGLFIGIDTLTESIWLAGGGKRWEMWSDVGGYATVADPADPGRRGLVVAGSGAASPEGAAIEMLDALARARGPFGVICPPFRGGLLSAEAMAQVIADLNAQVDRHRLEAIAEGERREAPIVMTARALHLNPHPEGPDANGWHANCPSGRGHSIMISASSDQFGCGYCHRKGGPDELRRFHQTFHPQKEQ